MWETPARQAGVVEQLEAAVGAALGCAVMVGTRRCAQTG